MMHQCARRRPVLLDLPPTRRVWWDRIMSASIDVLLHTAQKR
jgi:hypothetical protein